MIGRREQTDIINELLVTEKSAFIAVTGRRRVGKTYFINQVFGKHLCISITGIQGVDNRTQINNVTQKIIEYSGQRLIQSPKNWQQVFFLFKDYLLTLPKNKKQVIFIDELPWICKAKSGFIQFLAHFWNDYLSKEKHFILVVCGSATSWIQKRIINDRGGMHNRITQSIHLKPFSLTECRQFFESKKINFNANALTEIYMVMGGIPFYLDDIKRGESPNKAIGRMCFSENGLLKNEYQNLYKALFEYSENHEALVAALAQSKSGIQQEELIFKSKVKAGGPFTRAMNDLILSGFIVEEQPYGKTKRGSVYRLVDEFSVFHHRFIKPKKKATAESWALIQATQGYKIWKGFAFESLCMKHILEIKTALGIRNVYTDTSSFTQKSEDSEKGFQIDLLIDRNDAAINLCECKFHDAPFKIDRQTSIALLTRRARFKETSKTKKIVFNTLITNHNIIPNEHSLDCIDEIITIDQLIG